MVQEHPPCHFVCSALEPQCLLSLCHILEFLLWFPDWHSSRLLRNCGFKFCLRPSGTKVSSCSLVLGAGHWGLPADLPDATYLPASLAAPGASWRLECLNQHASFPLRCQGLGFLCIQYSKPSSLLAPGTPDFWMWLDAAPQTKSSNIPQPARAQAPGLPGLCPALSLPSLSYHPLTETGYWRT